jgi:hypothetical protein
VHLKEDDESGTTFSLLNEVITNLHKEFPWDGRRQKAIIIGHRLQICAVSAYNRTERTSISKRKNLQMRFIFPAFMKLSENIINKMKCDYIDSSFKDLQTDLVTYLTMRLDKFNPEAGRAYSYYTRTAFNYLIAENQKAYSKLKKQAEPVDIDEQRNVMTEMHNDEMKETLKYFMDAYIEYCYDNLNLIFTNRNDMHVADSILHIFETRESHRTI